MRRGIAFAAVLLVAAPFAAPAAAQMPNEEMLVAKQQEAMEAFAWMDGTWQGSVTTRTPEGEITLTQTERVGTIANGTVRLIEGRGYSQQGELEFNAVAMIAFDAMADEYVMTANARGMTTRPWFKATDSGFEWGFEAGPAKISYVAAYADGVWSEEGFVAFGENAPMKILDMRLERTGDSDWPAAGAVEPSD